MRLYSSVRQSFSVLSLVWLLIFVFMHYLFLSLFVHQGSSPFHLSYPNISPVPQPSLCHIHSLPCYHMSLFLSISLWKALQFPVVTFLSVPRVSSLTLCHHCSITLPISLPLSYKINTCNSRKFTFFHLVPFLFICFDNLILFLFS